MRQIYTIIFWLLLPFILIRLLWRSWRAPAYRKRWQERFAVFEDGPPSDVIWLHAVSLGESIAAIPLIKKLLKEYPKVSLVVTNMTPTGSEKIRATFGSDVFNCYVPYDIPIIIKRFLKQTKPKLVIIMETELWPNIINCCYKKKIPMLLANARLSERSGNNYKKIQAISKRMLTQLSIIAVQTQAEADRFTALGVDQSKVLVTGSIKFDIELPGDLNDKTEAFRRLVGANRLVLVAASTHEGEEEIIINIFITLKKEYPNLLLLIVPRHPERFSKVTNLCKKLDLTTRLRTENQACDSSTDVFIGDTIGEMLLFYSCADVAFVGGSIAPIGGHNLLEPAALGKASITGPHMHNFAKITELLLAANAIKKIQDQQELLTALASYLSSPELRHQAGQNGQQVVLQNRGALQKHFNLIEQLCSK